MDHLEAAGTLVYLYGLTELPALPREMHEQIDVLTQQAELTADAMPRLRSMKDLSDYWIEVNRLENEGDRVLPDAASQALLRRVRRAHGAEDEGGRRRAGGGV